MKLRGKSLVMTQRDLKLNSFHGGDDKSRTAHLRFSASKDPDPRLTFHLSLRGMALTYLELFAQQQVVIVIVISL